MRAGNRRSSQSRAASAFAVAGLGWLALLGVACDLAAAAQPSDPNSGFDKQPQTLTAQTPGTVNAPRRPALPSDDWTYRPTVLVRRGTTQGSGTIIASVDGETLVLTAAHVLKDEGPVKVELHRYNLGLERRQAAPGDWPRVIRGAVVARDKAADVAIVRIDKLAALPYVARLAHNDFKLTPNCVVDSIGIDQGSRLTRWSSRLVETVWFELNDSRERRPFLITAKIPEHGRSGGGLFLAGGELIGVCVGHAEIEEGTREGVFASGESIRALLENHHLIAAVRRSELRVSAQARRPVPSVRVTAPAPANSFVRTTRTLVGEPLGPDAPP